MAPPPTRVHLGQTLHFIRYWPISADVLEPSDSPRVVAVACRPPFRFSAARSPRYFGKVPLRIARDEEFWPHVATGIALPLDAGRFGVLRDPGCRAVGREHRRYVPDRRDHY